MNPKDLFVPIKHPTEQQAQGSGSVMKWFFFLSAAAAKPWKCEAMCERPTETSIEHDKLKPLSNNTAVENSTQTRRLY